MKSSISTSLAFIVLVMLIFIMSYMLFSDHSKSQTSDIQQISGTQQLDTYSSNSKPSADNVHRVIHNSSRTQPFKASQNLPPILAPVIQRHSSALHVQKYESNAHSKLPRNTERRRTYMLALHTAEQLTMSTSHFIEFLNIVYDWNFTGVEPFVYNSRMFALRSMHSNDVNGSVYYHQLLNTSFMREKMSKCLRRYNSAGQIKRSSDLFVSVKEFLTQSVRKVVLVYFAKHMHVMRNHIHAIADKKLRNNTNNSIIDCTQLFDEIGLSEEVEVLLNQELLIEGQYSDNFTVIQAFCIMPLAKISLFEMKKYILKHIYHFESDASIVFISWQGKFTRPFTDVKSIHRCTLPADKIPPSVDVVSATNQFLSFLGLKSSSYIAVHVRFEKLFEYVYKNHENSTQFLKCCMLKLDATLKKLKVAYNYTTHSILLLHDYGSHGSDSCHYENRWQKRTVCVNQSQVLLSYVNETEAVEFNPGMFEGPQNSGFVSRVEGYSLSGGQTLIVVGGGSYQTSIVNQFHHRQGKFTRGLHNNAKHYRLCTADENLNGLKVNEIDECA